MTVYHGKQALVTGAGGFIGSHLVEALLEEGARVKALVHYRSNGSYGWLDTLDCIKDVEVVAGDVRDPWFLSTTIKDGRVDAIFNLAAEISVPMSANAPRLFVETNVLGTLNLLELATKHNCRLVVTSSSEVYGTVEDTLDECHRTYCKSVYAASKAGGDALAQAFCHQHETDVVIVRPFNTFGPRQSQRAAIASFILQALTRPFVRISHPSSRRDWVYVKDTVQGFLKAEMLGASGETYVLATGQSWSVQEIAERVVEQVSPGKEIRIDVKGNRPGSSEVEYLRGNATTAKSELGWSPEWDMGMALYETVNWFRENLQHYQRAGEFTL